MLLADLFDSALCSVRAIRRLELPPPLMYFLFLKEKAWRTFRARGHFVIKPKKLTLIPNPNLNPNPSPNLKPNLNPNPNL